MLVVPVFGQSEVECQDASKLHAEQDLIQQLFNGLWEKTKLDGAPALGDTSGERAENRSLQTRVRDGIRDCQSNGGSTEACGNYHRVRNAWLQNNQAGAPGAAMVTDPQTCKILDPDTGDEITPGDRPEGYDGVVWHSQFKHEQYHQLRCREANGRNGGYEPGGDPSPYLQRMSDPRLLAEEEVMAHAITQGVLEDYLRENCFDPALLVDADDMTGTCGQSVSGDVTLKSLAGEAKSWLVNTMSNLVNIHATGPVETPANGEKKTGMSGDCICCDGTTMMGKVRVYGGPGHSILVGGDDANIGCASGNKCGGMSGDPHMRTYDGLRYDFQGAGEFILARGEHFEVQARLEPWPGSRRVSAGTAVAMRLHGDVIALYAGRPARLSVMGAPTVLGVGEGVRLPGGALIMRAERLYRITTPDGFVLEATPSSTRINVKIGLPYEWRSVGLLGDRDEDRENDLRASDGTILTQPPDFETFYGFFGAGWRVTAEESLFEYAAGESADTFWDAAFPEQKVRARDLDAEARRKAEAVCRAAGVTDPVNLEDCILDVAVTGDASFAEDAAAQPGGDVRVEIQDEPAPGAQPASGAATGEVTLEAPAEGFSAHRIGVRITGVTESGGLVKFAPAGSDPSGKAENPYSDAGINGEREEYELAAPTIPGDYELRYVRRIEGEPVILARRPFRSVEPSIQIDAAPTAMASLRLTVRVAGDIGEHMRLIVAPKGGDEAVGAAQAGLKQGSEAEVTIGRLPAEPGEYELVVISNWAGGQHVYARRGLTLEAAGGVTLQAPSEGIAAHKVEVRVSGLMRDGDWVGFAPAGSDPSGRAANPYSAAGTNDARDVYPLAVPTVPGEYELRYREKVGRELRIVARQPFRSIAPRIQIDAAASAEAGGDLEVRLTGDIGEHMKVALVPAGSDEVVRGPAPGLREGREATVTFRKLAAEPGEYEIVCISNWNGGKHIYARRALTIR